MESSISEAHLFGNKFSLCSLESSTADNFSVNQGYEDLVLPYYTIKRL